MIEAPSEPISEISSRQAFRACLIIPLALPPPTREEWDPQSNSDPRPSSQFFETALLRSRQFVLDVSRRVFFSRSLLLLLSDTDDCSCFHAFRRFNPTTSSPTRSTSSTIVESPTDPLNSSIEAVSLSSSASPTDKASNGSTTSCSPSRSSRRVELGRSRSRNEPRFFVRSLGRSVPRRRGWRSVTPLRGNQGSWSGSSR